MKAVPTLSDYANVVRRRLWLILLCGALAVVAAFLLSVFQTPLYKSTASILINQNTANDIYDPVTGVSVNQADRAAANEVRLLRSELVRNEANDILGFRAEIDAAVEGRLDVVVVTAIDPEPATAQRVAQTYAETYLDVRRDQFISERLQTATKLQDTISAFDDEIAQLIAQDGSDADIRRQQNLRDDLADSFDRLTITAELGNTGSARIIDSANSPDTPFSPRTTRNIVLAAFVGLAFGVGLAFLLEGLDSSIRGRRELEELTSGTPILGVIPTLKSKEALVALGDGPESEVFRTFRAGLEFATMGAPMQIFQITSPAASAGKTTVAANLGVVLARTGKKVVIVDADLRRPRLHTLFDLPQVPGLSSMVIGLAPEIESSHPIDLRNGQLVVIPSGPAPPGPSELLGSENARQFFDDLRSQFDVVIVDSAPVLPVADALVLSRLVDATIVVVNARLTKRSEVITTLLQLEQAGASVLGTALNDVKPTRQGIFGYGYGYGYGDETSRGFFAPKNGAGRHPGTVTLRSSDLPTFVPAQHVAKGPHSHVPPLATIPEVDRTRPNSFDDPIVMRSGPADDNSSRGARAFAEAVDGSEPPAKIGSETVSIEELFLQEVNQATNQDLTPRARTSTKRAKRETRAKKTTTGDLGQTSESSSESVENNEPRRESTENKFGDSSRDLLTDMMFLVLTSQIHGEWDDARFELISDPHGLYARYSARLGAREWQLDPSAPARRDAEAAFVELAERNHDIDAVHWSSAVFTARPDHTFTVEFTTVNQE